MPLKVLDIETFSQSEKMASIQENIRVTANKGLFEYIIPFADLKDLDESIMVFRLLTQGGYLVGSHDDGMLVKW